MMIIHPIRMEIPIKISLLESYFLSHFCVSINMYCTTSNLSKISAKSALNEAIRWLQAMCLLSPELDEEHSDIIAIVDDNKEILRQTWTIGTDHMIR